MGISLRTETTGICPTSDHGEHSLRTAVQSDPKTGSVIARELNERPVRTFELRWSSTQYGEVWQLQKAWRESGHVFALDYTPIGDIDANSVECLFVPGSLSLTQMGPNEYQMSADLEELL